ncbi:hypothetical protein HJG60_010546 [Phyllostomus discolor]|uniref:Uncharacterized protein n=1 Tax=Phyllostomus discolor TaxID=89673 RepID=A0A834EEW3_9CHIR|nr:hypothetical protein HJG60_010546 [Phyllostomus discolor]
MEMETEYHFKLEVKALELSSDLIPESPAGTQVDKTIEMDISQGVQGPGTVLILGPGKNRIRRAARICSFFSNKSPEEARISKEKPASEIDSIISPKHSRGVCSAPWSMGRLSVLFQPNARTLRGPHTPTAIIAAEMAKSRWLVSKLTQKSVAQLQGHLDQHNAHMAVLVQLARGSYTQHQEVAAILQSIVDDPRHCP